MDKKEKDKFRRSSKWRNWRNYLLNKRNYTCEISGLKRKKGMNVHHHNPDRYKELKEESFSILTKAEHRNIERLLSIKNLDIDNYCENLKRIYLASKS